MSTQHKTNFQEQNGGFQMVELLHSIMQLNWITMNLHFILFFFGFD